MVGKAEGESGGIFAGPKGRFESTWGGLGWLFLLVKVESTGEVSGMMSQNVVGKDVKFLDFFGVFVDSEGTLSFEQVVGKIVDLGIDRKGGEEGVFDFWADREVVDVWSSRG